MGLHSTHGGKLLPLVEIFPRMSDQLAPPSRIGRRIRKLRELKNLTQEHLAGELGMSVSGYSRIERDEVKLSSDKLVKISEVLGISLDDLMKFDESFIFQNHGTLQGYSFAQTFAHNSVINDIEHMERLYREQIDVLKDEVKFLREQLRMQQGHGA